jgi:PAP_fibrillin
MIGKADLLAAIADKNRGLATTETENQAILAAIAQLEGRNPYPRPLEVPQMLDGDWRLLYTTSRGILGFEKIPFLQLGEVYQCVRTLEAKIYNIAEIQGLPLLEGIVSVAAQFKPVSERRVNVQFERSIIGLQRLIDYQTPEQFVHAIERGQRFMAIDFNIAAREQAGWLDITYLDDNLRIGRGNEGSVFVLIK